VIRANEISRKYLSLARGVWCDAELTGVAKEQRDMGYLVKIIVGVDVFVVIFVAVVLIKEVPDKGKRRTHATLLMLVTLMPENISQSSTRPYSRSIPVRSCELRRRLTAPIEEETRGVTWSDEVWMVSVGFAP
jgi:hypothetical protein